MNIIGADLYGLIRYYEIKAVLLETEDVVNDSLHWILDLMEYADENYYRIYTFSVFFKKQWKTWATDAFGRYGECMMKCCMIPNWRKREV